MNKKVQSIGIKLPSLQKNLTYITVIGVAISGLWWSYLHDLVMSTNFDLMHNLLVIHGVFAAFTLMVLGALIPQHMRLAWKTKRNLKTGLSITIVLIIISVSGLGLYYAGEDYRDTIKWLHLFAGIASVLFLPIHIVAGIGSRNKGTKLYAT